MAWLQVATTAGHRQPQELETVFTELGAVAVWLSDAGEHPVLEPAPGETPGWPETIVTALFDEHHGSGDLQQRLQQALPDIELSVRNVADRDWQQQWQQNLQARQFGDHLWVVPENSDVPDGAAVVRLEPGMAFGTGEHPTTAMCLDWLAAQQLAGCSVLDYGCGSGLLAIAAMALEARHGCAVDIDPQALRATQQNASRNNCLERLLIVKPDAVPDGTQYDVLVANILSGTLVELAPALRKLVRDGAALALTGILEQQASAVADAWSGWADLSVTDRQGDWVLLSGNKRGNRDR